MTTATRLMLRDRNVIQELTTNGFLATDEQIEALARYNLQNVMGSENVRGIYLKSLIVAVQHEIQAAKVEREPKEVLDDVHSRFYKAIMRAVTPKSLQDDDSLTKEERKARAHERNRRSNFARSAKSTVLSFIKSDGDIMQLNAVSITKGELAAFAMAMRSALNAPMTLKQRAEAAILKTEELLRQLADQDKPTAVKLAESGLSLFADLMVELNGATTNRSDVAMRDHKFLELPAGKFWPVLEPKEPITVNQR